MHDKATLFAYGLIAFVLCVLGVGGLLMWELIAGFVRALS